MKGVILAGGMGKRLQPLTNVINKHLLPVGRYPMIYHCLDKLHEVDITEIAIVTGRNDIEDVTKLLGDGTQWNLDLTYRVQHEPKGIAHALSLTEDFVGDEPIVVLLGDNIFEVSLTPSISEFIRQGKEAHLFITEVDSPERYGVPTLQEDQMVDIREKPAPPPSSYAVTGIYLYEPSVFDTIEEISPSENGEYEITDVNKIYIERSEVSFSRLQGWWYDAGTLDSYLEVNRVVEDRSLGLCDQMTQN